MPNQLTELNDFPNNFREIVVFVKKRSDICLLTIQSISFC